MLNQFIFHNVHPGTQHQRDASARYVVQDAAEWADHDYHDFFHPNVAVPWLFFGKPIHKIWDIEIYSSKWIVHGNDIYRVYSIHVYLCINICMEYWYKPQQLQTIHVIFKPLCHTHVVNMIFWSDTMVLFVAHLRSTQHTKYIHTK